MLTEVERGAFVAGEIWLWLQAQRRVQYVPWAVAEHPEIQAAQAERENLLQALEQEFLYASARSRRC